MAQRYNPAIVNKSLLEQQGLEYHPIDLIKNPVYLVKPRVPHAIVRDDETGDHLGVILYSENYQTPRKEFDHGMTYLFWRQVNLTVAISSRTRFT